jgi:LmbE family N-acetylglucosaminyl deacetylase
VPTALAIHAHPDDEAFANAGRLRQLADRGYTVVGVIATAGEASELPAAGSLADARRRRIAKYERALATLGASAWVWLEPAAGWIDAPGGPRVADAASGRLKRAVLRLVGEYSPDMILTVGADGLTGHPDHVAIARAVMAVTDECSVPGGVWGARLSRDDVRAGLDLASSHADGRPVGSGRVTGTDAALTVCDVGPFADARRAALDVYRNGLGTAPLAALFGGAERVGDSVLLRAIYDAEGWRAERYQRRAGRAIVR